VKVHKVPGPDGLPNWLLCDFSSYFAGPVCAIYNASVREDSCRHGGRRQMSSQCRKFSRLESSNLICDHSLSCLPSPRFSSSFVGSWILGCMGDSLDDRQFGARRHRSTTHALVDMMHHWHTAVDNG